MQMDNVKMEIVFAIVDGDTQIVVYQQQDVHQIALVMDNV